MFKRYSTLLIVVGGLMLAGFTYLAAKAPLPVQAVPESAKKASPSDGHTIHVLAPHVVEGKVMGPFHHYCKVISPEPVTECLIYESTEARAPMTEVEYIVA